MSTSSASESKIHSMVYPSFVEAKDHVIHIASQSTLTTPCGELKCQHDSMLANLASAKVVSFATFLPQTGKKKKNKKKKNDPSNQKKSDTTLVKKVNDHSFVIVLSDSIFFPEGGGQPSDCGQLIITQTCSDKNQTTTLDVTDAQNIEGTCVLTCKTQDATDHVSELLSLAAQESNSENIQIFQHLNWEKRWEYMTSHSAQHLVSAVAMGEYGIGTQSFSLRPDSLVSYIDFQWDPLTLLKDDTHNDDFRTIFSEIEQKVNDKIQSYLSMTPTWMDISDKESYKDKEGLRSRLLPKDLTGKIRLVNIDGIDLNTCCGTHVTHLSQLQMIKFFRVEKFKSNIIRVYFAAGKRLMKIMDETYNQNAILMSTLSCTEQEIGERVSNLLEEKKDKENQMKIWKEKLSVCHTAMIIEELKRNGNIAVFDLEQSDMGYMSMLSSEVAKKTDQENSMILLIGSSNDSSSDEGTFLLTGPQAKVDDVKDKIAKLFEGRGGGNNGKFQGKGNKIRSSIEEVKSILISVMI